MTQVAESISGLNQTDEQKWVRRALHLSWFTIGYNLIEGVVSIALGVSEDSMALMGFGGDSFIEVFSAILVLWRFRGQFAERERTATLGIGFLFLLLATLTAAGSGIQLISGSHPETTVPGLVISAVSLSFMFFLWKAKLRVGTILQSPTVLKDAACSLACIQLSGVLFAGSLVYLLVPSLWWADGVAALALAGLIAHEGWGTVRAARSKDFDGGCCGCG